MFGLQSMRDCIRMSVEVLCETVTMALYVSLSCSRTGRCGSLGTFG